MSDDMILAVDPGFAATGLALMKQDGQGVWVPLILRCIRTKASDKKLNLYKASDDMARIQSMAGQIIELMTSHGVRRMVVELPHGGAQSSAACRAMALASAMIATIAECLNVGVEWYTPRDTRNAAGVPPSVRKGKDVKALVFAEMAKRYPVLWDIKLKAESEHIADALSCFEAARRGNFIRGA